MNDEKWLDTVVGGSELDNMFTTLRAFKKEEFNIRSDWTGLCPFRGGSVRCHGSATTHMGGTKYIAHDEHCPYSLLAKIKL
jgi:hypothetical protein